MMGMMDSRVCNRELLSGVFFVLSMGSNDLVKAIINHNRIEVGCVCKIHRIHSASVW